MEGPFLSFAKRGAQAAENLHKPDPALFHRLNEASGGQVKLVTVACEEEGALPFIREMSTRPGITYPPWASRSAGPSRRPMAVMARSNCYGQGGSDPEIIAYQKRRCGKDQS